ncbi:hypothetical protein JD793_005116 [Citrobacter braakii]|nr:hypothetical protein [Citrobacter braakii]
MAIFDSLQLVQNALNIPHQLLVYHDVVKALVTLPESSASIALITMAFI